MRHTKLILLTLLILLSALPSLAQSFEYEGITYQIYDKIGKTCAVYNGSKAQGDITIPETVTNGEDIYTVVALGRACFGGCKATSIVLPQTIVSIEDYAFNNCTNITSIDIPSGVTSISYGTFQACSNLSSINIPNGVTSIGEGAFSGCSSMTSFNIPEGVTSIGGAAFGGCSSMTSFNIPTGVTSIESFVFSGCSSLTSFNIPTWVTSIGSSAFSGCTGLTSIIIPDGVTSISNQTFENCTGLTSIDIPNSVTSIERAAFMGCSGLTSIDIPDGVTSIAYEVFRGCTGLTSINIPNGVTSIGQYAFRKCSKLTSINMPDGVTSFGISAFEDCSSLETINIPSGLTSISDATFMNCTNLASVNVHDGVSSIGNSAFSGCTNLTSIDIPDGVTSIGKNAFYNCSSLTSIKIPDGVSSISNGTFSGCTNLASINMPTGLISIEEEAFKNCLGLTTINIPDGVTAIGRSAFNDCSNLTSINIPDGVTSISYGTFSGCSNLSSINIPDRVTSIGEYAFYRCTSLTSFIIPEGVTSIEAGTFGGCTNLASINIPDGLTLIGASSFANCSRLTSITIPNGVTTIAREAFYNCHFEEVTYYATTPIEAPYWPFSNYTLSDAILKTPNASLSDVKATYPWSDFKHIIAKDGSFGMGLAAGENFEYNGIWYTVIDSEAKTVKTRDADDRTPFNNCVGDIVIPSIVSDGNYDWTVTEIGYRSFINCQQLTSVTLPETLVVIQEGAFEGCHFTTIVLPESLLKIGHSSFLQSKLTVLDCPDNLKEIENYAFWDCSDLTSIALPASLEALGDCSFHGCQNLRSVTYMASDPKGFEGDIFATGYDENPYNLATLYTPNAPLEAILATEPWNKFKHIIAKDGSIEPGLAAGDDFEYEEIWYTVIDADAKTVKTKDGSWDGEFIPGNKFEGDLAIPETVSDGKEEYLVVELGEKSFIGNEGLLSIKLPSSLTSMGVGVFYGCSKLKTIDIPDSIKIISGSSFDRCSSLESIKFPNNLIEIGGLAFANCSALKSLEFPETLTTIESFQAFANCTSLTNVHLPESLTFLGEGAFLQCPIETLYLPGNINTIDESAFGGSGDLKSITYAAANPIEVGSNLFAQRVYEEATLNMPNAILADIQSTEPWRNFKHIIAKDGSIEPGLAAGEHFEYEGIWYTVIDAQAKTCQTKAAESPESGNNCSGDLTIPSIVSDGATDYNVIAIGQYSFYNCVELTSILLPESVTSIKEYAFDGCSSLTSINIPAGVTSIERNTFENCSALSAIHIPEEVTEIGLQAFRDCSSLTSITIPEGVNSISDETFSRCTSLTSIYIPDSVTTIGESAFDSCTSLIAIDIPDDVTSIGRGAFDDCSNLTSITIPNGVTSIELFTFRRCRSLISINIPDGVTSIGMSAFYNCSSLTSINIPESVSSIEVSSFEGCSNLTSLTIPNGVTSIGDRAFAECSNLTSIIIPAGVTSIGESAFFNCNKLEEVSYYASTPCEAPENVFDSDYHDIYGTATLNTPNATLESVQATVPWNLFKRIIAKDGTLEPAPGEGEHFEYEGIWYTVIDAEAKTVKTKAGNYNSSGNNSSGKVTIPSVVSHGAYEYTVISIGEYSFNNCTELTSISIPESVSYIGEYAFYHCDNLASAPLHNGISTIGEHAFDWCSNLTSINIPTSLTVLDEHVFAVTGITEISIPESVTSIKRSAFEKCEKLENVEIPGSIEDFDELAFGNCPLIKSVTYSASTPIAAPGGSWGIFSTEIYENAILSTPDATLESVLSTTPWNNFKHIIAKDGYRGFVADGDDFEFEGITYTIISVEEKTCRTKAGSLEGGQYVAGNAVSGDITIPATASDGNEEYSVVEIGWVGFANCNGLTSISLPSSVTSIPESAFNGCSNLASITLPQSITSINVNAFLGCAKLSEVTLPDQLSSVGHGAFTGCSSLTSIVIPETLTILQNQVFSGCSSLKSINLPATLEGMAYGAFFGCDPNVEVKYEAATPIAADENAFSEDAYSNGTLYTPNAALADVQATVPWNKFLRITASDGSIVPFASEVKLSQSTAELKVGESVTLEATIIPDYATNKTVTWTSDNEEVVTVDANGKITAIALGEATITATCGPVSATCTVTVVATPVESIVLSKSEINLVEGDTETLTATIVPEDATDKTVTWTTSDASVATVSESGEVTAIKEGTATITVTSANGITATCTVAVAAKIIEASEVTLSQPSAELKVGETVTLTATISPEDTTDKTIKWSSDNDNIATVDSIGKVTAIALGDATITAKCGNVTATCKVTVVPTPVESVTLSNTSLSLVEGETATLTATVAPADATDKTVTWESSDTSVAIVSEFGEVTAIGVGTATITATSSNGKSASCTVTVAANIIPVTGITISNDKLSIIEGETATLTATITPQNATDLSVTWTTSDAAVATVSANGEVTAVKAGTATITATSSNGKSATCTVTVEAKIIDATGLTLSQTAAELKVGETVTLEATVIPEDATDKTVTWTSSNTSIATVDANGKVTAIALGEATISAKCGSVTATCKVTVVPTQASSITLSQTSAELKAGESVTLEVTVLPEDATDKTVTWTSSNQQVATVDANGKVTAIALGEATITAKCGSVTATCKVTVVPTLASSITLSQTSAELKAGESVTLEVTVLPEDATDKTVTWTSSNPTVATVDANGKVTAIALGEATITAKCGSVTATCKVTVVPTPASSITLSQTSAEMKVGESVTLEVTVLPEDATDKTVTWTSSNPTVATVDANGKVRAIALGEATITAKCGSVSATFKVTVVPTPVESITLSNTSLSLVEGETATLTATVAPADATDKTVTWKTSDSSVATVSANGVVTAIKVGTATITATSTNGKSASCSVTVAANIIPVTGITISNDKLSIVEGETATLTATITPQNATDKSVTWTTSDAAIATVSANGVVTAVKAGTATITVTSSNGKSATCDVTVEAKIIDATALTLSQTTAELKVGATVTLVATVIPEDATDKTVTWSSSNQKVATVDANGKVTAIALGEATISAKCGSVTATCKVTVVPTPVESVTLNKTSLSLIEGESSTLTATLAPADATDKTVTWKSSNSSVATVSANGVVTAVKAGTATITATSSNGKSASCTVTVAAKIIDASGLTLSQTAAELKVGETVTLEATVIPADATDKTVTWTSSNPAVATVNSNGTVTAISLGSATITARCGKVTATCTVTVVPTPATSIILSQSAAHLKAGEKLTLSATVLPADATDKTISWSSSNPTVATVDANGNVTAISIGEATITARCGEATATCIVSVVQTPAESISINQTSADLNVGESLTLSAKVMPDDATDKTVTWSSSDPAIASVDAAGNVTAISAGQAIITARCGNVTATCTVTVIPNPAKNGEEIDANGITYTVIDEENGYVSTKDGSNVDGDIIPGNTATGSLVIPSTVSDGYYDYKVTEIGAFGFSDSDYLTDVTIPASIENIGEDAFSGCERLTSIIWEGRYPFPNETINAIGNPNLLIYVDSIQFAPKDMDHNIVVLKTDDGVPVCENLVLVQGYAFTPAIDFLSENSSLTQEYTQATVIGECAGWESIVLPFDVKSIYSEKRGELTPFAALTDIEMQCPFWLYEAAEDGEWKEASNIRAGVPYIISMPNNPEYIERYNIDGPVQFACPEPTMITREITSPYVVDWASGQTFSSMWLPLDEKQAANAMGLNVGISGMTDENGDELLPGSAFCEGVTPRPLEAYVTRQGSESVKRIFSDQVGVRTIESINGLEIKAYIGKIIITSDKDRKINVYSTDGTLIRSVKVKGGTSEVVRDLTRGLYLIAGQKILVK